MKLIECSEFHAELIRGIFNESILSSTAIYDYECRTPEMMARWFEAKRKGNYPVLGALSDEGVFMGFASYGTFRERPAYKYTVEHSVYVKAEFRGRGVGKLLLREIVARAVAQNYHVMVGGIDSQNAASIALHEQFGFKLTATMPQVGFKFGRWLDLVFYQLVLDGPAQPVDG